MSKYQNKMHLNAFLYQVGHHEAAWRLNNNQNGSIVDLNHFINMSMIAERAKFDAVFLADTLNLGGDFVADSGRQPPEFPDAVSLLSAISARTSKIGLIASVSTTYSEPYNVARQLSTLDHLSNGRCGWNVVTTSAAAAAANFGYSEQIAHSARYSRAREFIDVVRSLWNSWDADAIIADKESGMYADPNSVHPINFSGDYFKVAGALNISRSPQGEPVIVQAGSSVSGMDLAAKYAEVVFCAHQSLNDAQEFYKEIKARASSYGRDPAKVHVLPGLVTIAMDSDEEAKAYKNMLDDLMVDKYAHQQLANVTGVPVERLDLDEQLPDDIRDLDKVEGLKGRYALTVTMARERKLTIRQILRELAAGRGHQVVAGDGSSIADRMEYWFQESAADGFNVMPAVLPSGLEAFVEHVVPVLRERSLIRDDYDGRTLRENLGLLSA